GSTVRKHAVRMSKGLGFIVRSSRAALTLFFLAFSLRPSHLGGESAVPHSPRKRKERKESANTKSFQAAKDLRLSSTEFTPENGCRRRPQRARGGDPARDRLSVPTPRLLHHSRRR